MDMTASNPKARRTARDSVFCDLFSQDEYLLELYRSLHPDDRETTAADIELVTIERVVTDGDYNDLGFLVGDRLLVLVEAQTTWSANIVTRMLLYLAETYRRHILGRRDYLYRSKVVELPAPELYVVYTGARDVPDTVSFRGDVLGGAASSLDVEVRVLRGGGSDVVGQYVEFAHVFEAVRDDASVAPGDKAREVVRRCLERGILVPYMEGRRKEVEGIMFTLFDQERETRLYHEDLKREAREEGLAEGRAEGRAEGLAASVARLMESQSLTSDQAMDALGVPADQREPIAALAATLESSA